VALQKFQSGVIQDHLSDGNYKKSYHSLNCCSLRSNSKRASFLAIIDPDIVCGCESHLNNSFHLSEIFPDSYNVFRKDRVEGGGVFICVRKNLVAADQPTLDVQAELLWIKLSFSNQTPIYICSFYRPPNSDLYPVEQLNISLAKLKNSTNSTNAQTNIVLMGDINFPSITWHNGYGTIEAAPNYENTRFLDLINDTSLK